MLTAKHYESIGRLAHASNAVEDLIQAHTQLMLGIREWSVIDLVVGYQWTIGSKVTFFRDMLTALKGDHPSLKTQIEQVLLLLGKAKTLFNERNTSVHGRVRTDPMTKKIWLDGRQNSLDCDTLEALTPKFDELYEKLEGASAEVYWKLLEIRQP
jgi:hypothetical protein